MKPHATTLCSFLRRCCLGFRGSKLAPISTTPPFLSSYCAAIQADYFVWSLPSSWADLPLPWSELDAVYQRQAGSVLLDRSIRDSALDTVDVWKLWAGCVEQSVAELHHDTLAVACLSISVVGAVGTSCVRTTSQAT